MDTNVFAIKNGFGVVVKLQFNNYEISISLEETNPGSGNYGGRSDLVVYDNNVNDVRDTACRVTSRFLPGTLSDNVKYAPKSTDVYKAMSGILRHLADSGNFIVDNIQTKAMLDNKNEIEYVKVFTRVFGRSLKIKYLNVQQFKKLTGGYPTQKSVSQLGCLLENLYVGEQLESLKFKLDKSLEGVPSSDVYKD